MKLARLAVLCLMITSGLSPLMAQSKKLPDAPPLSAGGVAGRVMSRGKGLAGVVVRVWRQNTTSAQPGALSTKTDADGNYRFGNVFQGNYNVSVDAPGFVVVKDGQPSERPRSISLSSGETISGIDFAMVPGGIVTGTVTDSNGKPIVKEQIRLIQVEPNPNPNPNASPAPDSAYYGARTDNLGNYRVTGVPSGRYKVAAGPSFTALASINGRPANPRAFYPNASDESKAQVVEVKEGEEVSNIDIKVGAIVKVFAITGRIVDSKTGQAVPNIHFSLTVFSGGKRVGSISEAGASDADGEFKIEGVPEGRYSISVPLFSPRLDEPPSKFIGDSALVDVINQDLSGLEVRVVEGARVSGVVVLEGTTDKGVLSRQLQRRLQVASVPKTGGRLWSTSTLVGADGSFSVSGLGKGTLNFQFRSIDTSDPTLFRWGRLERDGVELPDGIEIKEGDQITGLRIILVYAIGSVRGEVKLENGSILQNTRLAVRLYADNPRDSAKLPGTFVDSRGHFLLENVPAGKYKLIVSNWTSGALIKPSTQDIVVAEGGVADVKVVIELEPNSKP